MVSLSSLVDGSPRRSLAQLCAQSALLCAVLAWVKYEVNLVSYRLWKRRNRGRYPDWCRALVESFGQNDLLLAFEAARTDGGSFDQSRAQYIQPKELLLDHICFAGGGFRTISYMGQLLYLEKRGFTRPGQTKFWGASFGAMFATGVIFSECNRHVSDLLIEGIMCYLERVHDDWWGMWGVCGEYMRDLLVEALPDDISAVNGRVHISITVLVPYPHNVLVSEFLSKQDFVDALIASQFIPGWTDGLVPFAMWRGRPCIDGGLFDNIPSPPPPPGDPSGWGRTRSGGFTSLVESFRRPTLEHGRFICRDAVAPITQVLTPPPAAAAEHSVIREIKRGYLDAMRAVQDAKGKVLQPTSTTGLVN
uniref:PNPLA domain-containing protein n=2 Tax=Rhizochromulina marina TaxID=1034831 RepID=A0A7S2SJ03_9STRA